jgi:hypothetical protein
MCHPGICLEGLGETMTDLAWIVGTLSKVQTSHEECYLYIDPIIVAKYPVIYHSSKAQCFSLCSLEGYYFI